MTEVNGLFSSKVCENIGISYSISNFAFMRGNPDGVYRVSKIRSQKAGEVEKKEYDCIVLFEEERLVISLFSLRFQGLGKIQVQKISKIISIFFMKSSIDTSSNDEDSLRSQYSD